MSSRGAALATLAVVVLALVAMAVVATPWRPPPPPAGVTAHFTPEQVDRADAFHGALRPWSLTGLGVGLLVAAVFGFTPLGARVVEAVARPFGGGWAWQAALGGLALGTIGLLVTLPFSARAEVVLRRYGLSNQDWGGWFADVGKAWAVSAVLTAGGLLAFYAVVRAAPNWWWAWAAGGAAALVFALSFAFPLLVEPLFNRFTPMPDSALRTELVAMATRDGVPVRDVLVADASRRTTALNAYVSGYGASRRIVVYDTLLDAAPADEVKLVVAHELSHAKHDDVLYATVLGALGAAVAVCAAFLFLGWAPLLRRAGVDSLSDPRSVGLLLAAVALVGFLAAPAQNLLSRRIEARADEHALALTRDPSGFVAMQRRLAVTNLADPTPNPVLYVWFASHPATLERIALARKFAAREGLPLRPDR